MPSSIPNRGQTEDSLSYLLARASHAVVSEFHGEVKRAGMTLLEWRVLVSLTDGRPKSVGVLAELALAQQPTLTKLLDRLADAGHIERQIGPSDRRRSLVSITPTGKSRIAPLLTRSKVHERRLLAALEAEEAGLLKGTLKKLIRHIP